jgi:hypothetical protein
LSRRRHPTSADEFCCDAQRCPLVGFILDGQFCMRRRDFIALLGSAAAAWPLAASAQQAERMRRIDVLMAYAESDRQGRAFVAAFQDELQKLGCSESVVVETLCYGITTDALRARAKGQPAAAPAPQTPRCRCKVGHQALLMVCRRSRILWRVEPRRQRDDRSLPLFAL